MSKTEFAKYIAAGTAVKVLTGRTVMYGPNKWVEYLNSNFEKITDIDNHKGLKIARLFITSAWNKNPEKAKQVDVEYVLANENKNITINNRIFNPIRKAGLNGEEIFKRAIALFPNKKSVNVSLFKNLRELSLAFIGVGILVILFGFAPTQNKNYSGVVNTFSKLSELTAGEYVKTDLKILDFIPLDSVTTQNVGVVQTNKTQSKSDTYALAFTKESLPNTFIIKYSSNSDLVDKVENKKEYDLKDIMGEVRNLSALPKLSGKNQVLSYLQESVDLIKKETTSKGTPVNLEYPSAFIDTSITQGDKNQAILTLVLASLPFVLGIIGSIVFHILMLRKAKSIAQQIINYKG
ncbi:MAG: hypothetical protein ABI721_02665 [Candidatus Dojkabacteria bacterium]